MKRRVSPIIKLAFVVCPFIYAGIGMLLRQTGAHPAQTDATLITTMAYGLAVVYALVVLLAPKLGRSRGPIVTLACYESGAIYGLVLFMLSGNYAYLVGFGGVAVVLMLAA